MQGFINSFTDFIIGFLGYLVSTSSGQFYIIISLVLTAFLIGFRYFSR